MCVPGQLFENRPTNYIDLDQSITVTEEERVCATNSQLPQSDVTDTIKECELVENEDLCLTVYDDEPIDQLDLTICNDSHVNEVAGDECVVTSHSTNNTVDVQRNRKHADQTISDLEGSALYDVTGWAVSKVLAVTQCDRCSLAFSTADCSDDVIGHYTAVQTYGGLTHPTLEILHATQMAESIFRASQPSLHNMHDIEEVIVGQVLDVLDTMGFDFPRLTSNTASGD